MEQESRNWREDIQELFGVRWGTLAEWIVISMLCAWFWTSWHDVEGKFAFPSIGPLHWLASSITQLGGEPPQQILQVAGWIAEPSRGLLVPLSLMCGIVATLAVRGWNQSGLHILALLLLTAGLEAQQSFQPIAWALGAAALPMLSALAIAAYQAYGQPGDQPATFYASNIFEKYLLRVVGLFVMPVVAPAFLLGSLVAVYRTTGLPDSPQLELARTVRKALEANPTSLGEVDSLTALAGLASMLTAQSDKPSARRVAWTYQFAMERAHGGSGPSASRTTLRGLAPGSHPTLLGSSTHVPGWVPATPPSERTTVKTWGPVRADGVAVRGPDRSEARTGPPEGERGEAAP